MSKHQRPSNKGTMLLKRSVDRNQESRVFGQPIQWCTLLAPRYTNTKPPVTQLALFQPMTTKMVTKLILNCLRRHQHQIC